MVHGRGSRIVAEGSRLLGSGPERMIQRIHRNTFKVDETKKNKRQDHYSYLLAKSRPSKSGGGYQPLRQSQHLFLSLSQLYPHSLNLDSSEGGTGGTRGSEGTRSEGGEGGRGEERKPSQTFSPST
eukprot:2275830-Rhodomonas_salina.2